MIHHEDCLAFLNGLSDDSVDLIINDPPYFEIMKNDWDNQWEMESSYIGWCMDWTRECTRVLKPNKCFYVWGTTKTNTFLRYKMQLDTLFGDQLYYNNWIIWSYDWGGRTKQTFPRKHEDLLMYSKGKTFPFYADAVRIPYKMAKNVRNTAINNPLGKVPTDVWEKNNHTASKEYVDWHPNQKPLSLLERIIKAHTLPGELVLDCFSGSGSTAIACDNTGRKFIGCEQSEEYYNKSLLRRSEYSANR